MQQKNLNSWKYDKSLDCMLFFAQRVDELLFHHTTDTYRYSAVSLRGLAQEFSSVYEDALNGIINVKNLRHIIDEFNDRLKADPLASQILTTEYIERFSKNYGSWDVKRQYENVTYIGRKLSNHVYCDVAVSELKRLIQENKEKKLIDELATLWVREVIDCGYNENYIYKVLHNTFFFGEVSSLDALENFFSHFDFSEKKFDVYIGLSTDISGMQSLFEKIYIRDSKLTVLAMENVPTGIKTRRQKSVLKFEALKTVDMYSAYDVGYQIAAQVVNAYGFFRHDRYKVKIYGQVVAEDNSIVRIDTKDLLKYRVSQLSHQNAEKNADVLLQVLFSNMRNRIDIEKVIKIHNSAIQSENVNDSLLSLWSLLESLVEDDMTKKPKEKNNDEEKSSETSRSKIGGVIEFIVPFIKSTYIEKIVRTCMEDIMLWDKNFFDENIANNGFGKTDIEHTFAFLTFASMQDARDALYAKAAMYPLLKYRVANLYEQLHNSKHIKSTLAYHEKRITWHMYRIYRARNYIVHDATGDDELNKELLINLHSYIDIAVAKIVELITESPFNDCISDVLPEHKLEVSVWDEKLDKQSNEDVNETNALKYLYYDYKR